MYKNKSDLTETFSNLEIASFKKKTYDICMIFAMETNNDMSKSFDYIRYPAESYYNINDMVHNNNKASKGGPPKKKRTPVCKSSNKNEDNSDSNKINDKPEQSEKPKKKKNKSYPIVFNRNIKSLIDFMISRFLWEVYSIDDDLEFPENKEELISFILEHAPTNFPQGNITELILNVVPIFKPFFKRKNTYDLDREMRCKFDAHLNNSPVSELVASYMVDFLKILSVSFSNHFWLEKTQTVNIKLFETTLRQLEFLIPVDAKTISHGLMTDMIMYDKIIYPPKSVITKKKVKKSDEEPIQKSDEKSDEEPENEKEDEQEDEQDDEQDDEKEDEPEPVQKPVLKRIPKPILKPIKKSSKKDSDKPKKKKSNTPKKKEKIIKKPKKAPVKVQSEEEEEEEEEKPVKEKNTPQNAWLSDDDNFEQTDDDKEINIEDSDE
jgi:hypothetical protein